MEHFRTNNTNTDPFIKNIEDTNPAKFGHINAIVDQINNNSSSGTYTPTISGETNGIVVYLNQDARYIKVGSIVNVFAQLEITMDAGETTGLFEISLPVASNLTSQKDCFGMMQFTGGAWPTTELDGVYIEAKLSNNACLVNVQTLTAGVTLAYCTLQFTYEIL